MTLNIILDTGSATKGGQDCTRFEEIANNIVQGANVRIGFFFGSLNKFYKFRICGLLIKGWKTEWKIDVWTRIEVLKFRGR